MKKNQKINLTRKKENIYIRNELMHIIALILILEIWRIIESFNQKSPKVGLLFLKSVQNGTKMIHFERLKQILNYYANQLAHFVHVNSRLQNINIY